MNHMQLHDWYMNELVRNLEQVGEDRTGIEWIMRDGIWMKQNSLGQLKLCDLIIGYYDGTGSAIELKGSKKKRRKAMAQVRQGIKFLEDRLGYTDVTGKIVYYSNGQYQWEQYP